MGKIVALLLVAVGLGLLVWTAVLHLRQVRQRRRLYSRVRERGRCDCESRHS